MLRGLVVVEWATFQFFWTSSIPLVMEILHNYGNYVIIFLIMGNAGFISSTVPQVELYSPFILETGQARSPKP